MRAQLRRWLDPARRALAAQNILKLCQKWQGRCVVQTQGFSLESAMSLASEVSEESQDGRYSWAFEPRHAPFRDASPLRPSGKPARGRSGTGAVHRLGPAFPARPCQRTRWAFRAPSGRSRRTLRAIAGPSHRNLHHDEPEAVAGLVESFLLLLNLGDPFRV